MASDYFLAAFWIPILIGIAAIALFRIFAKKAWLNATVFGMSWRAINSGILGALAGLYVYVAGSSYLEAIDRVAKFEELREQGALSLAWGWSIYLFILIAPFLLFAMALLLFPVLALLSRLRLVSATGVLLIVLILVGGSAGFALIRPDNPWCEANLASCALRNSRDTLAFTIPIFVGFVVGARMPLFRSRAATDRDGANVGRTTRTETG